MRTCGRRRCTASAKHPLRFPFHGLAGIVLPRRFREGPLDRAALGWLRSRLRQRRIVDRTRRPEGRINGGRCDRRRFLGQHHASRCRAARQPLYRLMSTTRWTGSRHHRPRTASVLPGRPPCIADFTATLSFRPDVARRGRSQGLTHVFVIPQATQGINRASGCVWNAQGARQSCASRRTAASTDIAQQPMRRCCCFGGRFARDLFITSARHRARLLRRRPAMRRLPETLLRRPELAPPEHHQTARRSRLHRSRSSRLLTVVVSSARAHASAHIHDLERGPAQDAPASILSVLRLAGARTRRPRKRRHPCSQRSNRRNASSTMMSQVSWQTLNSARPVPLMPWYRAATPAMSRQSCSTRPSERRLAEPALRLLVRDVPQQVRDASKIACRGRGQYRSQLEDNSAPCRDFASRNAWHASRSQDELRGQLRCSNASTSGNSAAKRTTRAGRRSLRDGCGSMNYCARSFRARRGVASSPGRD